MVTIIDSTVRSNVYETIYDTINAVLSSMSASSTPVLYGGYPDIKTVNFPCIIIQPITVGEIDFTIDSTRSSTTKEIVVVIEIYAEKNKDLDIIADYVINLLKTTSMSGIFLVSTDDAYGIALPGNNKVKQKTLSLTFARR